MTVSLNKHDATERRL